MRARGQDVLGWVVMNVTQVPLEVSLVHMANYFLTHSYRYYRISRTIGMVRSGPRA